MARLCARDAGVDVFLTPHLYHLPEADEIWAQLLEIEGHVVFVAWMHTRPMRLIAARHGFAQPLALHMGTYSDARECFTAILDAISPFQAIPASGPASVRDKSADEMPHRWYPEIDHSRCANCGHCLQFCLFSVYSHDDAGKVAVSNPDNCKPGCPACARICPNSAIIFPLYREDPAISGAPGCFVARDAAARRMYYLRTRRPCPLCGGVADVSRIATQTQSSNVCNECGSILDTLIQHSNQEDLAALDDIDRLINDLDDITRRNPA